MISGSNPAQTERLTQTVPCPPLPGSLAELVGRLDRRVYEDLVRKHPLTHSLLLPLVEQGNPQSAHNPDSVDQAIELSNSHLSWADQHVC